jgi:hypothetical protein
MRFNPPPNWPTPPEGWRPEPGWQPDPSWGPAPEGWQLWVGDGSSASSYGLPPAARKRKNWFLRHKILTGLGALLAVIVGASSAGGGSNSTNTSASGTPSPTTTASAELTPSQTSETSTAAEATTPTPETATTSEAAAAPKARTYSGRGDKVLRIKKPETGAILATVTRTGPFDNFVIYALDEDNEEGQLVANTLETRYKGTALLDADGSETTKLKIDGTGRWTIKLRPLADARRVSGKETGHGPEVLIYDGGPSTLKFTNKGGDDNVVVYWITNDGQVDLAVNDIGSYSGEAALTAGPGLLHIEHANDWTVEITED